MTHPKKQTAQQLAAALRDMADAIEASDSFEGSIAYEALPEKNMFNVEAFWRIGNSEGQGGSRMIAQFGNGT